MRPLPAFAAWSDHGLSGLSHVFHDYLRETLLPRRVSAKPRPVLIDTWEAVYCAQDMARLKGIASAAADLGVERFVLDDGWFGRRDDATSSLGDWWVDPRKYPDGLGPLVDHVSALGMEFGLWIEPEMVNPASELYASHPDWCLHIDGHARPTPPRSARARPDQARGRTTPLRADRWSAPHPRHRRAQMGPQSRPGASRLGRPGSGARADTGLLCASRSPAARPSRRRGRELRRRRRAHRLWGHEPGRAVLGERQQRRGRAPEDPARRQPAVSARGDRRACRRRPEPPDRPHHQPGLPGTDGDVRPSRSGARPVRAGRGGSRRDQAAHSHLQAVPRTASRRAAVAL